MKKNNIIIIAFCIISYASSAQTQITKFDKKLIDSVSLRISLKTCVLLETDTFVLFTPMQYFIEPFAIWVKEHPELQDDKILYKAIAGDTAKRLVKAHKIAYEYNLTKRMNPQIAGCLRIGRCIIYNKITEKLEKKITIEDYLVNNHGVVKYIVNGSLLFKVNN